MRKKRIGSDRFKILAGIDQEMASAHIPSVLNAIKTGQPYPIKAMLFFGNNGLVGFANSKDVYESFTKLDFIVNMDLYMTPTAELADIVLPAASWLEYNQVFSVPSLADHVILPIHKITSVWECRPDEEVFLQIAKRMGLDYGAEKVEDIIDEQLSETARRYPQFEGLNFKKLIEMGWASVDIKYKKYEERGFNTPSGKMEIYSSILENYGYEPLPYYQEPPESPYSDLKTYEEYPLILTTGGRVQYFFHSEGRQIPSLRKKHPDPIVEINTQTAKKYGIKDGDWIFIETKRGKIQQKAKVHDGIDPRVINCQNGWWFPEDKSPEHGVWKSNANVLTNNQGPYDPIMGTYQLRALLCKIYKDE
jgi:anaerobic selenocysteine-containing dehydrogenase